MTRMNGSRALVEALKREGVEAIFGLPGVQIMSIFDALYDERGIRLFTVRHEQSAIYMADGYARVKGRPGVGLVVPGPGVQNASAALGTAYACSSPVLLLAGQVNRRDLGQDRGALHELNDQLDVVRPVTKWCRRVMAVEEIPEAVREAMCQMATGRPRPTEIEIPWDVLSEEGNFVFPPAAGVPLQEPNREEAARAARLLAGAKRPLIWAGGGVILSGAWPELVRLAERLGAPVATTPEGKGAISEDHPLSLGAAYYGFGAARWALPKSDVILAAGTRLTGQMYGATALRPPQRLIHLDADSRVIGKNYPAEVSLVGDARAALKAILDELAPKGEAPAAWPAAELEQFRGKHRRWLGEKAPRQSEIIAVLRRELPDEAILFAGVTNVGYWCHLAFPARQPRTFFTPSYSATLGYAFPTALGAKVAAPDRPVVCVIGDGGFLYACVELATAVRYGIHTVTIVFTDGAFGSTKSDQQLNFQGRIWGTDLNNPDFARLAELFGAKGIKAEPEQLGRALREALEAGQPTVIEVPLPTLIPPFQLGE